MKPEKYNVENQLKPAAKPLFWGYSFTQISLFFAGIFVLHLFLTFMVSAKHISSVSLGDLLMFVESTLIPVILFICVREIKKSTSLSVKPWVLLFIATLFNLFGDLYNFIAGFNSNTQTETPLVVDICYILFYPILIWGLLSFEKHKITKTDKIKLALDLSVIYITFIIVLSAVIVGSLYVLSNNNPQIYFDKFGYITPVVYPVLDLSCLFTVIYIFLRSGVKIQKGVLSLIELGIILYTFSDLLYFFEKPAGLPDVGGIVEHGYIFAEILLILAGIYQILTLRYPDLETKPGLVVRMYYTTQKILKQTSSIWIVFVAVTIWWLKYHPEYPFFNFSAIGLVLLLILSTVRFYITAKENNLITSNLKRIVNNRTIHLKKALGVLRGEIDMRKKADEKLKESEEKYRMLYENNPNTVLMYDYETLYITDCNESFRKMYGYSDEEAKKLKVSDLSSDPDITVNNIRKSELLTVIKFPIRYHRKKDGTVFPVEVTHTSMFINNRLTISAIIKDISEKIETEKKQKEYTEELEKLNKTKDKFFSIIAHDLRNPFQGLLGYLELLDSKNEIISESEKAHYISQLNVIAGTLYNLVDNLLQWTRLQSGKLKINKTTFNLRELSEKIVTLLTINSFRKEIKFINEIPQGQTINADEMSIKLILSNLLTNAIKFSNPKSDIALSSSVTSEGTYLYVKDNGIGIPPERLRRLFDSSQQDSLRGTGNEYGSGLGLLICKELIELNGGTIRIESELQKGTTVEVFIPGTNHLQ
ncbi:MAG TPA: PAS domain-containing sensor histidine kinase [Ignavibacteria bacterium]|nr:PAS domain-containing sensor histidine kinase [Ignavibacteria bacterium]